MLVPLLQAGTSIVFLLFFAFIVVLSLVTTAVTIYATDWTYTDASRRGMDSPELWAIIVFFGSVPGIIAYLLVRE